MTGYTIIGYDPDKNVDEIAVDYDIWYDRSQRLWVVQITDDSGSQIGNADWTTNKSEAKERAYEMLSDQDGITRCESGWTDDRCSFPQGHLCEHSNEER